jgi:hypothetical protein
MTNKIYLNRLRNGYSGIMPSLGSFMCDCAIYTFVSQGHSSGVILNVKTNEDTIPCIVTWEGELTTQMQRTMGDNERATDHAAMCVAVLLILQLTDYKGFTSARRGTGVDFWLFKEEPFDDDITKAEAMLEISGIRILSRTNTIETRLKTKAKQVLQSIDKQLDVYIVITEFSTPKSLLKYDEFHRGA